MVFSKFFQEDNHAGNGKRRNEQKIVAVLPGDTLEEAARLMRDHDGGASGGVRGELKGVVTDRDIILHCVAQGKLPAEVKSLSDYDQGCRQRFSQPDRQRGSPAYGERAGAAAAGGKRWGPDGMVSMADNARRQAGPGGSGRYFRNQRAFRGYRRAARPGKGIDRKMENIRVN